MDLWVQRLDASVHDLGEACNVGNTLYRDARLGNGLGGSACGEKCSAKVVQGLGKVYNARFVGYREKYVHMCKVILLMLTSGSAKRIFVLHHNLLRSHHGNHA